jgi:hypothetical protein
MFEHGRERIKILNYIYNNNDDVEAINVLQMIKTLFNHLVNTFRTRELLE